MVILLKTLSILFKGNLNFLFFFLICKKMLSDVNYTIAFVSHWQHPLTSTCSQVQLSANVGRDWHNLTPYSNLPPPSPLFTNCKPTQDADHWPMTQSPIHAGCFQSGDVSPGVLRLIRMSYCLGVASRSRPRVSKVMGIIPMLWEAFVSQCSRKSDTKNKSQVW